MRDRSAFMAALVAFLERRTDVSVVLPLQGRYVAVLAEEGHHLRAGVVVASPAPEVVLSCLDKLRMYDIARDAGVPYRHSFVSAIWIRSLPPPVTWGFPCVIRPTGETGTLLPGERKVIICRDRAGLGKILPAWPDGHPAVLVQRFVDGPRQNLAIAAKNGRIVAHVETRALRTDQADGTGLTALALVMDCGLDLARAAVDRAAARQARQAPRSSSYAVGRRYAWSTADLHALRMARAKGTVGPVRSLHWLGRIARAAIRADVRATWSVRDPLPTLAILAQWLPAGPWTRPPLRDRPINPTPAAPAGTASRSDAMPSDVPSQGHGANGTSALERRSDEPKPESTDRPWMSGVIDRG